MPTLNREKFERDLADIRQLGLGSYFGGIALYLFVIITLNATVWASRLLLSHDYSLPFFNANAEAAPNDQPIAIIILYLFVFATIISYPVVGLPLEVLYELTTGYSLTKTILVAAGPNYQRLRPQLRTFLITNFFRGLVCVAVGDVMVLFMQKVFHAEGFWIPWGIGLFVGFVWFFVKSYFEPSITTQSEEPPPVIRGTLLNTFKEATMRSLVRLAWEKLSKPNEKRYVIRWAGIDLPGDIESHFGIVGINGSGKTLALQTLMRSVIPTIRDTDPGATAQRALVFDPESKFVPFLQELAGEENVHILNPFDTRSRPWDLSKDIGDLATAQELASIFVPENKNDSQPFFQRAARGILSATLKALHIKAEGRWTLRHVFHIVTDEQRLTTVLKATDQTQGLVALLRPTEKTLFNVLADLRTYMDMLELVSALWDHSVTVLGTEPFTLKKWLETRGVLVFGRPTQLEETILALNRVLIKRASQLIRAPMSKDHIKARGRTWIFLDELRNIGMLPGLNKLLTEGRARGARAAITFQDIDGLRQEYPDGGAEEISNQIDSMSYLRCRGATAKWAAERLGRCEYWDKDFTTSSSSSRGTSSSTSDTSGIHSRRHLTDAVLESELSGLPLVQKEAIDGKPGGYVEGWHIVSEMKCIYPAREKDTWYPFENMDNGDRVQERDATDQILRPWDDKTDWDELGFRPEPPPGPPTRPDIESLRG